jgi:hypothetical protein
LLHKFWQFTVKQQIQRMTCLDTLLATSRQIAADSTKHIGSLNGPKTTGYFLLGVWFKNSSVSKELKIHHDFGKNHDEFRLGPKNTHRRGVVDLE